MTRKEKISFIKAFRQGEEIGILKKGLPDAVFSIIMKNIYHRRDPVKYPPINKEDKEVLKQEGYGGLIKTYINHD